MFEVSLDSSWPKDSPSCEAPGFPEPASPEIRKNVFDKYFLCPKKLSGNDGYHNSNLKYLYYVLMLTPLSSLYIRGTSDCRSNFNSIFEMDALGKLFGWRK